MDEDYKLAKWLNNELTDEELAEFKKDSDYDLYNKIRENSALLKTPHFDENKMLTEILKTKKAKVISMQQWFVRIAAVFVIGFGLFFGYQSFSVSQEWAENGKKVAFSLPDNSNVFLNSGSSIEFKIWNWENNRKLKLNGEAYFKVAKGKTFEVNTNLGKVTVLGTQFNVKARNNRFDITCFEGKVKVNYKTQEIILTKGQTISFENNQIVVEKTIEETEPSWKNNELSFEKERLKNVLFEIENQYNISIEFNGKSNQLYTGKIPSNDIETALKLVTDAYHLDIQNTAKNSYILKESK